MEKFSLTYSGIIVMVAGPMLVQYVGFSDTCANEIADKIPVFIGAVMALIGRYRLGGVSVAGWKGKK